jgi:mRNA interferase RelE/StbE
MYSVRFARRAERGLRRIRQGDPGAYRRIVKAIRGLGDEPRPVGAIKLTGYDPPAWRLRVGEYRVVYEVRDSDVLVIVVNVAPRGDVYK